MQETVEFADGSSRMVPVAGSTAKVREVARPTVANTVTGRWRQPGPKRGSPTRERPSEPDSAMSAARQKVTSLEAALNVLVGHSGSQVHVLKAALQKAKERTLTEQLAFTESFIERSRKRIEVLETKKGRRGRSLGASDATADRLRRDFGPGFRTPVGSGSGIVVRSGALRAMVAELEARASRPPRNSEDAARTFRAKAAKRRLGTCSEDVVPSTDPQLSNGWKG